MPDVTLDRPMPCNLESERAVLGAILLDQTSLYPALEAMSCDDLYLEAHRRIMTAMRELRAQDAPIDPMTVIQELRRTDKLESAGGAGYILNLSDGIPRCANVRHYAGLVREASVKRQFIHLASNAMSLSYAAEDPSSEIIESLQMDLLRLAAQSKKSGWLKACDLITDAYAEIEAIHNRKMDVTSALGGEIKALEIEVLRLSRIIGEKREDREVAVYERVDKESRRMETIREDTAEVVSYRPLRPEECNLELWPAVAKS